MSEPTPTCIGGVYRFLDESTGETIEVAVSVDIARAIEALDDALARREKLQRRHERSLHTLAGGGVGVGEFDLIDPGTVSSRRDGPRLCFTLLIGSGARWDGPHPRQARCPCCGNATLVAYAYCLACDRSGRDDLLKPPVPAARPKPEPKPKPKKKGKAEASRLCAV